ncbi:MAG: hypothetical protein EBQ71_06875 [Betaproteobacteria bacterium]|nr:hypothetical protein [Betaproteobacteria bacterium]
MTSPMPLMPASPWTGLPRAATSTKRATAPTTICSKAHPMLRIHCPYCGVRDHEEFSYFGDATKVYPPLDAEHHDGWVEAVTCATTPRACTANSGNTPWPAGAGWWCGAIP